MDINSHQLNEFLKDRNDEGEIISLLRRAQHVRSYTTQGEIKGIALTWNSSIHPYCTYLKMVIKDYAPQVVEGDLLSEIEVDQPLQSIVSSTDQRLQTCYAEVGFDVIRKTYIARLKTRILPEVPDYDARFVTVDRIGDQKNELISLVKNNYEMTHRANPVAKLSHEQWGELIFAEDLITEGSFVALDPTSHEITAYSFLHEGEEEGVLELGWCGGDANTLEEVMSIQAHVARNKGFNYLEGEFDTTDHAAMSLFNTYPFHIQETFITYREQ